MTNPQSYNVEYNIPKIGLTMPGRQNRSSDGVITLTPGVDEPYEFVFGQQDGAHSNLIPFNAKLIFGNIQDSDDDSRGIIVSNILLTKNIKIIQRYSDRIFVLLSNLETSILYNAGTTFVNWAIILTNKNNQSFLAQVSNNGSRAGTVRFDMANGMPNASILSVLVTASTTTENFVFGNEFSSKFH